MEFSASIKDELTSLFNYNYFYERVRSEIERSNRYSKPYSIVRFDIDNFKEVNNKFGFEFGNVVLKQVAEISKNTSRGSDIIARQEAENFLAMLPEVDLDDAFVFAERLRRAIEENKHFGDEKNKVKLTVSMGIVTYIRKEGMEINQLMQILDTAVYQAKQNGRNCIVPYTSFMPQEDYI